MKCFLVPSILASLLISPGIFAAEKPKLDEVIALAEKGNARAQLTLAVWYRDGVGVKQDYAQAMHLGHLAADHGYAPAMTLWGTLISRDRA